MSPAPTAPITAARSGHVEFWTLNRPEARNPISDQATVDRFVELVDRVNDDHSVRAIVLTGSGPAFSSGGDIKAMAQARGMFGGAPYEQRNDYRRGIQRIPMAIYGCDVPIIAAVNGPAIGAGCDLALMCDLRIASSNAFFAESFVKLGLIPGDGGAWMLPAVVGQARAAEMLLTGDRIDAATALAWGLISEVVPPESLMDTALNLAARVAANPTRATRLTKRLLRDARNQTLVDGLEMAATFQVIAHQTEDHQEALAALVEKRSPRFA